jgi:alpha-L-fucosidase 2
MVFGGVASERLQLNEDTLWAGAPYDPANPEALVALPEIRRLIDAGDYAQATKLANAKFLGAPKRQMAYQTIGDLKLDFEGLAKRVATMSVISTSTGRSQRRPSPPAACGIAVR